MLSEPDFSSLFSLQVLVMLCFPLFSYAGVVGTASGMVDLKDMKPLLNMLRPSSRALMVRCFDRIHESVWLMIRGEKIVRVGRELLKLA